MATSNNRQRGASHRSVPSTGSSIYLPTQAENYAPDALDKIDRHNQLDLFDDLFDDFEYHSYGGPAGIYINGRFPAENSDYQWAAYGIKYLERINAQVQLYLGLLTIQSVQTRRAIAEIDYYGAEPLDVCRAMIGEAVERLKAEVNGERLDLGARADRRDVRMRLLTAVS